MKFTGKRMKGFVFIGALFLKTAQFVVSSHLLSPKI